MANLGITMNGVDVNADGSLNSTDDCNVPNSPLSRMDVTNSLSPLLKLEEDYDEAQEEVYKEQTNGDEYMCEICFQKFDSKPILSYHHSREHCGVSRFKCDICMRKFAYEDVFMTHCRLHNGNKPFYCPLCNTWFQDYADLNSHAQEFQIRSPIHCFVCGQRSARKFVCQLEKKSMIFKKLKMELTVVYYCEQCQPKGTHDCAVCGRIFAKRGYLSHHYRSSHRSVEAFKCGECYASFSSRCTLDRHLEMHPGRQKPWICHLCGLRFQQQTDYNSHLQDHNALKPFACSKCRENFHSEEKLKLHLIQHSVGTNESSPCTMAYRFTVSDKNNCANRETEISVNEEVCIRNIGEVVDSGREAHIISTKVNHGIYSSDCIQMEISNTHAVSQDGGNLCQSNKLDLVFQKSSTNLFEQEVACNDNNHIAIQEQRRPNINGDCQYKVMTNLMANGAQTVQHENATRFSFDCVKQEVFDEDECAAIKNERIDDQNLDSLHTKGSTVVSDCALNCVNKVVNESMGIITSQECPDLGTNSAIVCCSKDDSKLQIEESEFLLGRTKSGTLSEKENNCQTVEQITVKKESETCLQLDEDSCSYENCVKEERCMDSSLSGEVTTDVGKDYDEFCPLDLLNTEITSSDEETPADNGFSLSEDSEGTILPESDPRSLSSGNFNQLTGSVIKTDHSSPSGEIDIESAIKEESNSCFSFEGYFEEAREEMECNDFASSESQDCDLGNMAEICSSVQPKQFSVLDLDQKVSSELQLHQVPVPPADSLGSMELTPSQSLPPHNFYHAETRRHKCCFCDKLMESSIALRQHYRTIHQGEPRYLCRKCGQRFQRHLDLVRHTSRAHKTKWQCSLCDKMCLKQQALELHYEKHLSKKPYFCVPCQTWFRDLDELQSHRNRTRPYEERHYCSRCGCMKAWKFERRRDEEGNLYLCEVCERRLERRLGKKLETCEGCGQIFHCFINLEKHYIREHTGQYRCSDCGLFFDTKCILREHMVTMCGTRKVSTCTSCGRQFRSAEALQQHAQVHYSLLHPQKSLLPC